MRKSPRTCNTTTSSQTGKCAHCRRHQGHTDSFEVVHTGEAHPQLDTPIKDTVLLSAVIAIRNSPAG